MVRRYHDWISLTLNGWQFLLVDACLEYMQSCHNTLTVLMTTIIHFLNTLTPSPLEETPKSTYFRLGVILFYPVVHVAKDFGHVTLWVGLKWK